MAEFFGQFNKNAKPLYIAGLETVKEYTDRQVIRKKSPKVQLRLNPFFPPFLPLDFVSEDYGGLIQSATWEKSRNQSHGAFTVILAADDVKGTSKMTGWPLNAIWRTMGASLRDIFKPMSLAQLWVDGYHVMTGYLRVFRKKTSKNSKIYTAQFDELGALYQQNILKDYFIGYGEEIFIGNNPLKALSMGGSQHGFFPLSMALYFYVQAFITSSLNYGLKGFPTTYLSGSDLLPLAFRLIAQPSPIGGISNSMLWSQLVTDSSMFMHAGSSFWDFIKSLAPEPFIEMFTESGGRTICTGKLVTSNVPNLSVGAIPIPIPGINMSPLLPGFNYLIVRTCPYDNPLIGISPWHPTLYPYTLSVFDLIVAGDFVIITDEDVIEKDLGVSDMQQYTVFDVNMNGKNASNGTGNGSMNRPSISSGPLLPFFPGGMRTYAPRLMETSVDASSVAWAGVVFQSIQRWTRKFAKGTNIHALSTLLNVWFRNAAKFNEGTIQTRSFPYARPGMVLLYLPTHKTGEMDDPRDIGVYYIDNVTSEYNLGKPDITTFTVIRGTPIPNTIANLVTLLMDWEILPPGLNLFDMEL